MQKAQNSEETIKPEEISLEKLEKDLELLSSRIKTLAKKNGFSKELKRKVAFELN